MIRHGWSSRVNPAVYRVTMFGCWDTALMRPHSRAVAVAQRRLGPDGEDADRDRAARVGLVRPEDAAEPAVTDLYPVVDPVDAEIDPVLHRHHRLRASSGRGQPRRRR